MAEFTDNSIKKASINLSRNRPVALVVGAAGFLGSHLVDKLLDKNIQVIGIDGLKNGKKENLRKAAEDKNFHLILEPAEGIDILPERLDYLFIITAGKEDLGNVIELFKKTKSRCLFVSSVDLYDRGNKNDDLIWLKSAEEKIAKVAAEFNLNARILRLGAVFGPRMIFDSEDPLVKLLQQTLTDDLQKNISLEFSSRAIYASDAVDLLIRTIFGGSTSQKIFDGVNPEPVKVSEIKQVLMDPVWYENRDFAFSQLPPWPTPNLEKTMSFLNWHPQVKLLTAFRHTLKFFKDNEIEVPRTDEPELVLEEGKKAELEAFKEKIEEPKEKIKVKGSELPKFSFLFKKIYLFCLIALVTYALIWPLFICGWGVLTYRNQLQEGLKNLSKGEFEKSLINLEKADKGARAVKDIFDTLEPVRRSGLLGREFETGDRLINVSLLSTTSARSAVLGVQALLQGLKAVTGELADSPADYFTAAQSELNAAGENLAKVAVLSGNSGKLDSYVKLVSRAQALSKLLPDLVAMDGSKDYLILLQNNMELRPGGGFIGSFAKVKFENGKLKSLDVDDIYTIDGQLAIHVDPPKEIKNDLGQNNWYLRDSNWEPDFPTSARQAEWFYTKETGQKVEGVIALDVTAMGGLLETIGPLVLPDYKEEITADNLFEKAISHAEMSFFPGSQAKKSFLTALSTEAFNKIFFLPQNNWPAIISALSRSLDEKHISIYLDNPKLFSYADSQGWTHVLPRVGKDGQNTDFLSLIEANLGANKANYYIDRTYNLETVVGKDGEVKHRLRLAYVNRSPSDTFPGGKYKNRLRIYLPYGAKMNRALWGESDKTGEVSGFVDYGRSGFSILLELNPKEQKTLVLDYTVPVKLDFKDGRAGYRLDIIKQAGTLKDPLQWTVSYPISYELVSDQSKKISPQEQTISTDLSVDRSFELQFKK